MPRFIRALVLGAVLTLAVQTPSAFAVGTGAPAISAPGYGVTVANNFSGPISFSMSNAPTGGYTASLDCDSVHRSMSFSYDGSVAVQQWAVPALRGPVTCYVSIDNYAGNSAASMFRVAAPPLVLDNTSVGPWPFYPIVRDGYLDNATFSYRINRAANIMAQVVTMHGSVVRRVQLGTQAAGQHQWVWNGRKNDGSSLPAGTYKTQVFATADRTVSVSRYVAIATALRSRSAARWIMGYDTSSTSRGDSSCFVDFDSYADTVQLDCWGGTYAQANYGFAVPASAYNVRYYVNGSSGCCDGGVTSMSGYRARSTAYVVTVKVTDWHAYTINYVKLTYAYTYRV